MHITGMRKHSSIWPHIKEEDGGEWNEFTFDKQVNLFVGANAAGKTTLLNLLSDKLFVGGYFESDSLNLSYSENVQEWLDALQIRHQDKDGRIWGRAEIKLPAVTIGVDRPNESKVTAEQDSLLRELEKIRDGRINSFTEDDRQAAGQKPVPSYGGRKANDVLNEKLAIQYSLDERDAVNSMVSGADMKPKMDAFEPYTILGREMIEIDDEDTFMYMTKLSSKVDANFQKAILLSYLCAKDICAEVIAANFPGNQAVLTESRGGTPSTRVEFGVKIKTNDADLQGETADPFHVSTLSSGTAGTLWWVRHLAFEMLDYYGFQFGWEKKPMILLIDEIENHLHPTWQRRVIPALLDHFPGLQIFATTHSPFVVAGLKAGQVHLLNRDADGVVTASTNTEDIVGWTADEILRTMMGVEDPTDEETASAARELRQLRDEGPRDSVEAEAERQERMQELRRLVDRDLLAGGPAAAQRELFEQQFAEALEKYHQSRDLGQENG